MSELLEKAKREMAVFDRTSRETSQAMIDRIAALEAKLAMADQDNGDWAFENKRLQAENERLRGHCVAMSAAITRPDTHEVMLIKAMDFINSPDR